MAKPKILTQHQLPFIILIGILLLLIPTSAVIDALALKPHYSLTQLLSEAWRLVSGHLVHASWQHLLINVVNLILLRFVFREWIHATSFISFLLFSTLFISGGLWAYTNFTSYVGFSGVFHGLLCYLLLLYWRSSPLVFSFALACVLAKVIYEQVYGASAMLAEFIGVGVAIDAHALGAASGFVFYSLEALLNRNRG